MIAKTANVKITVHQNILTVMSSVLTSVQLLFFCQGQLNTISMHTFGLSV